MNDNNINNAGSPQEVHDNPELSRYEIRVGDEIGFLEYSRQPWGMTLVHTEVPKELEGHGLAGKLVKHAMDDARLKDDRVIPLCPYVRTWLERHPDYSDLMRK
jgi:predicted GNAT family acetyltransferase